MGYPEAWAFSKEPLCVCPGTKLVAQQSQVRLGCLPRPAPSAVQGLNVGCVLPAHRPRPRAGHCERTGRRNAPRTEPNCSSCVKKKGKRGGGRGGRLSAWAQFLWRYLEDHTAIFYFFLDGEGGPGGAKSEGAAFHGHSGPCRKVTFERTIAGLFGHTRCYE